MTKILGVVFIVFLFWGHHVIQPPLVGMVRWGSSGKERPE